MDLPVLLEKLSFVSSLDELRQTIVVLLKNYRGSFLQDTAIGSFISVHATDVDEIEDSIHRTLEQIPDLVVNQVQVLDESNVQVSITYKGNIEQFSFNIDNL